MSQGSIVKIRDQLQSDFISTRQAVSPIKKRISDDSIDKSRPMTLSFEGIKSVSGSFADELIMLQDSCREKGLRLIFSDLSEPVRRMIESIRKRRDNPDRKRMEVPDVPPPPADYLSK